MRNDRIYLNISELNLMLLAVSAFSCGLVVVRVLWTQEPTYISLIWNLFLAWIPYIISYKVRQKNNSIKWWFLFLLIIVWVLFYPNAPYIITDLFHLNERTGVPLWFDLVLLVSFAWNGVVLGLLSLKDMQQVVSMRTSEKKAWYFAIIALMLSGFGIYLGRYLRWNSWDVISQTGQLSSDLWNIITNPIQNPKAYGFTLLFSVFQIILYYSFWRFVSMLKNNREII